jgi:predicted HAD superfamily Cof-like phosphohydrolase
MNTIEKVLEFHEVFGCTIGRAPGLPNVALPKALTMGSLLLKAATKCFREGAAEGSLECQRLALLTEELTELADAESDVDALDALVDLRYVLDGTVIAFGFHQAVAHNTSTLFHEAFARVHAVNMSKLHDGQAVHDSTGKVVKPAGWVAADLSDLVV